MWMHVVEIRIQDGADLHMLLTQPIMSPHPQIDVRTSVVEIPARPDVPLSWGAQEWEWDEPGEDYYDPDCVS